MIDERMVRVGTLMPVPSLLRDHGVEPAGVFEEFALEPECLDDPDFRIPFATMVQFQARCAEVTHYPHFGLLTGERDSASALGAVGYLVRNSPDVRTAIAALADHFQVHNRSAAVRFVDEEGSFAILSYTILEKGIEDFANTLDEAAALGFNLMRELCGQSWLPTEVQLAHVRPRDLAPFRRFFRAPLWFDACETAVIFDRYWLDKPLPGADPLLNRIMSRQIREAESHFGEDLVGQLRRMLPQLITADSGSLAAIANRVGVRQRTLSRRLAAEGTSFMQLRDEACSNVACQLLQSTHMPANEIADLLGYSHPSAFTRAFHRWTGMGPARWRASKRRPAA